ncbi:MAG: DUF1080 domain-containing protein [Verrucomicrobiales bacterium]|nr:DUF1080 domain-containing protein [Verrucomicrobiales bacterium]
MQTRILVGRGLAAVSGLILFAQPTFAAENPEPFLGRWALTIPGGGAGWLEVRQEQGWFDGSILWGGGSVVPVSSVFFNDGTLYVTRVNDVERKGADGKVIRKQQFTELLAGSVWGDTIEFQQFSPNANGQGIRDASFSGKRIPALPPAPDLSAVKFGEAISLFNGKDLSGWQPTSPRQPSGWMVEDGILRNKAVQEEGKPHKSYTNLKTEREFEDFNLTLEVRVPPRGNSGIYLRGIYEVQVTDSYGRPLDSHNMGGVYSRITPTVNAEKPANEWQSLDITLVDRHVTVILNGKKIIDNQPLMGCTGGALWSDEFRPGPLYLQGDHTSVDYRKMVLRPVVK